MKEVEAEVLAKDREMELMEDNHRVEVRVYLQKVKHLEYEHTNNAKNIGVEGEQLTKEEKEQHEARAEELKKTKKALTLELAERQLSNGEDIKQMRGQHAKNLQKMREGFERQLEDLKERQQKRLEQLEEDLELRRKVHLHEIEERKNLHINDLMTNHEKAFGQMKSYYNDITADNLKLIKNLKGEVADMKKKAIANQKLMQEISQENVRLKEPLSVAVAEVADLRAQLKDRQKDRLSLRNSRARLRVLEQQLQDLQDQHDQQDRDYATVEKERDDIYASFEAAVKDLQQKADYDNVMLEQKLDEMQAAADAAQLQVHQIAKAADLDAPEMDRVGDALKTTLAQRNRSIRDTRNDLVRMTKCYNDALRTLTQRLLELGIPKPEIDNMGFTLIDTNATTGPAGLVVK